MEDNNVKYAKRVLVLKSQVEFVDASTVVYNEHVYRVTELTFDSRGEIMGATAIGNGECLFIAW